VPGAALLDVNVLIALTDPDHVHHELAHDWFAAEGAAAWATCPLTENGFLRVLASPGYHSAQLRPAAVASILRRLRAGKGHEFWPDGVSLADSTRFDLAFVGGYRQLTDVYLLGLAHAHGGALATFDRTIPVKAVRAATRATLHVIEPA
jgi:toxin-antitoxin system PIN domain toxin